MEYVESYGDSLMVKYIEQPCWTCLVVSAVDFQTVGMRHDVYSTEDGMYTCCIPFEADA